HHGLTKMFPSPARERGIMEPRRHVCRVPLLADCRRPSSKGQWMNRARVHRCGLLLVAGACVLATGASGCGKGSATADVSGTIKIAGKPPKLERFQIAFMGGRENQIVTFPVALDGTYTATGVPVGEGKGGFVYIPPEA